jgi:hypothetical protein
MSYRYMNPPPFVSETGVVVPCYFQQPCGERNPSNTTKALPLFCPCGSVTAPV